MRESQRNQTENEAYHGLTTARLQTTHADHGSIHIPHVRKPNQRWWQALVTRLRLPGPFIPFLRSKIGLKGPLHLFLVCSSPLLQKKQQRKAIEKGQQTNNCPRLSACYPSDGASRFKVCRLSDTSDISLNVSPISTVAPPSILTDAFSVLVRRIVHTQDKVYELLGGM